MFHFKVVYPLKDSWYLSHRDVCGRCFLIGTDDNKIEAAERLVMESQRLTAIFALWTGKFV